MATLEYDDVDAKPLKRLRSSVEETKSTRIDKDAYQFFFLLEIIDYECGTVDHYVAPLACASVARLKEKIAFCESLERDWLNKYASMRLAAAFHSRMVDDGSASVFSTKDLVDTQDLTEERFDLRDVITDDDLDAWDCEAQPSSDYSFPPAVFEIAILDGSPLPPSATAVVKK